MLSAPLAIAFLVILYRESQYNKYNQTGDWEFNFSAEQVSNLVNDGIDSQFLSKENIQEQEYWPENGWCCHEDYPADLPSCCLSP